jgi:hypothetical protein
VRSGIRKILKTRGKRKRGSSCLPFLLLSTLFLKGTVFSGCAKKEEEPSPPPFFIHLYLPGKEEGEREIFEGGTLAKNKVLQEGGVRGREVRLLWEKEFHPKEGEVWLGNFPEKTSSPPFGINLLPFLSDSGEFLPLSPSPRVYGEAVGRFLLNFYPTLREGILLYSDEFEGSVNTLVQNYSSFFLFRTYRNDPRGCPSFPSPDFGGVYFLLLFLHEELFSCNTLKTISPPPSLGIGVSRPHRIPEGLSFPYTFYFLTPTMETLRVGGFFREEYERSYHTPPSYLAGLAYDGIFLLSLLFYLSPHPTRQTLLPLLTEKGEEVFLLGFANILSRIQETPPITFVGATGPILFSEKGERLTGIFQPVEITSPAYAFLPTYPVEVR